MLELCMFAEASKHQEEVSLVGTRGAQHADLTLTPTPTLTLNPDPYPDPSPNPDPNPNPNQAPSRSATRS